MAANSLNGDLVALLTRVATALERLAPPVGKDADFHVADAFIWQGAQHVFQPVTIVNRVPLVLLTGIDYAAEQLLANTKRFAAGLPANNALLWGARGMGKSSLVKAVHAEVASGGRDRVKLVEVHREEIATLPACLSALKASPFRFIVFCDDLSFDSDDTTYKSLKAVLEGSLEGRPQNVLFYATSNRRHLMPRDMVENERSTAINPSEAVEEKVSLSDRFGLWLGFHNCTQDQYLSMVRDYARAYGLDAEPNDIEREALEWCAARGARSGRVAWQFIQDLAGRLGVSLDRA